ncbi:TetR/AcrR family transcriptional regulator [Rhodovarius crocodyli]|uniref:TetR/AcrR family transcriptional regulator n=1 Tax=Rhodovarius crocodyli TaxID=1979269 RepID=A0A437MJI3_9PROT|nr:TetR/AcrR family transcriptional regulator [Rhodovarius crocodyli]RVT97810.1 TetR/AcrR family transcriptional regulator [Rhodovarius crocodyli]
MKSNPEHPAKRSYRQGARAIAAEQTAHRILDAFDAALTADWFDLVTLDRVARDAGVSVPTVVRRFGSKEGLLEASWQRMAVSIKARRVVHPGDIDAMLRVLIEDYEITGDKVMRALHQEARWPALRAANDIGRRNHRAWVGECMAPWLAPLPAEARERRLDALVAATDLTLWNLIRRDMGRPPEALRTVMFTFIMGAIAPQETPDA